MLYRSAVLAAQAISGVRADSATLRGPDVDAVRACLTDASRGDISTGRSRAQGAHEENRSYSAGLRVRRAAPSGSQRRGAVEPGARPHRCTGRPTASAPVLNGGRVRVVTRASQRSSPCPAARGAAAGREQSRRPAARPMVMLS